MVTRENKGRVVGKVVFEIDLQGFAESCDCSFRMELYPLCFGGQKCRFFGEGGIFHCLKPSNSVGFAGQGSLSCLTYLVCR